MSATAFEPAVETRLSFWEIDPDHTEVGFEVKHLMISKVRGRFGSVRGTIAADEGDPAQSTVSVDIDVHSIDTHQNQRDEHLRSADFFDAARYPEMSFRGTAIEQTSEGLLVKGKLTFRDTTRALPVP